MQENHISRKTSVIRRNPMNMDHLSLQQTEGLGVGDFAFASTLIFAWDKSFPLTRVIPTKTGVKGKKKRSFISLLCSLGPEFHISWQKLDFSIPLRKKRNQDSEIMYAVNNSEYKVLIIFFLSFLNVTGG